MKISTLELEKITGNCEWCGTSYLLDIIMTDDVQVLCPTCLTPTDNWDTVNGSMYAPFIATIYNDKPSAAMREAVMLDE